MKNKFWVCYDYETGGIWRFVWAKNAHQISSLYPELDVTNEIPEWMTRNISMFWKTSVSIFATQHIHFFLLLYCNDNFLFRDLYSIWHAAESEERSSVKLSTFLQSEI